MLHVFPTGVVLLSSGLFILSLRETHCHAEYFSSIDSMEKLREVELGLVKIFREYLVKQREELDAYRKFVEHVKAQHSEASADVEDYLGNPINAFTLIKRMDSDWNQLQESLRQSTARADLSQNLQDYSARVEFPDDNDLKGAIAGLVRLQKIYELKAEDLAEGDINDVNYGTSLSWHDCYQIATDLYDEQEVSLAINWFKVAMNKLQDEENEVVEQKFRLDILEYLAMANHELGNTENALDLINEILDEEPQHSAKDTKIYIMYSADKQTQRTELENKWAWLPNYTRLCQGIRFSEKVHNELKCHLETRNKPYFILEPLKVEQLHFDPEITLIHGVLNDAQIDNIVAETGSKLFRSYVLQSSQSGVTGARVSQQAWLAYTSPTTKAIYNLMSDITGLDMNNGELIQLANYGIGGQYEPHYDYFGAPAPTPNYPGDRIMTNIFYLSDVEQGGYTVFPNLNLFVRPEKGALLSWYNLHRSLHVDTRTLHSACPVVKGSKRIAVIWINSLLQEFRRPCGLTPDHDISSPFR